MHSVKLRVATLDDALAIQRIYEHYVQHTAITFDYEVPTLENIKKQIEEILTQYPYLVCEIDKKVIGYAYAHPYMQKAAYQWNAVLTVYLDKEYTGFKIGQALYHAIVDILTFQNFENVYACVTHPNPKSEKLHTDFGFKIIGVFEKTGYKNSKWYDTVWLEKKLYSNNKAPNNLVSFREFDPRELNKILDRSQKYISQYRK